MEQQINLYQLQEKTTREILSFRQILQIFGAFIGILFLIAVYDAFSLASSKKELQNLEKIQKDYSQKLHSGASAIAPKQTREQMVAEQTKLEQEIGQQTLVISKLKSIQNTSNEGFSDYMTALAQQPVPGLWLTQFSFKNQEGLKFIRLQGSALTADLIPKFLDRLSREPVFEGSTFQVFSVTQEGQEKKDGKTNDPRKIVTEEEPKDFNFILETVGTKS